jgi:hypothetical protein
VPDHLAIFERHKRSDDYTVAAEIFNEFGLVISVERRSTEGRDCRAMLGTFFNNDGHQQRIVLPTSRGQSRRASALLAQIRTLTSAAAGEEGERREPPRPKPLYRSERLRRSTAATR